MRLRMRCWRWIRRREMQVVFPLQAAATAAAGACQESTRAQGSSKKNAAAALGFDRCRLRLGLFDLRKAGFNRLYQAGQVFEFSTPESCWILISTSRCSCWWTGLRFPRNRARALWMRWRRLIASRAK